MTAAEDDVSRIFTVLSHPLRRQILVLLNEKGECSFTDISARARD
jgi:DNA-binding transcriptional ArsR family regulator